MIIMTHRFNLRVPFNGAPYSKRQLSHTNRREGGEKNDECQKMNVDECKKQNDELDDPLHVLSLIHR